MHTFEWWDGRQLQLQKGWFCNWNLNYWKTGNIIVMIKWKRKNGPFCHYHRKWICIWLLALNSLKENALILLGLFFLHLFFYFSFFVPYYWKLRCLINNQFDSFEDKLMFNQLTPLDYEILKFNLSVKMEIFRLYWIIHVVV